MSHKGLRTHVCTLIFRPLFRPLNVLCLDPQTRKFLNKFNLAHLGTFVYHLTNPLSGPFGTQITARSLVLDLKDFFDRFCKLSKGDGSENQMKEFDTSMLFLENMYAESARKDWKEIEEKGIDLEQSDRTREENLTSTSKTDVRQNADADHREKPPPYDADVEDDSSDVYGDYKAPEFSEDDDEDYADVLGYNDDISDDYQTGNSIDYFSTSSERYENDQNDNYDNRVSDSYQDSDDYN